MMETRFSIVKHVAQMQHSYNILNYDRKSCLRQQFRRLCSRKCRPIYIRTVQ